MVLPNTNQIKDTKDTVAPSSGIVYIFSHDEFDSQGFARRLGAQADIEKITKCFKDINFEVEEPFENFTTEQVCRVLDRASKDDFSGSECLLVIIITQYNKVGQLLSKDSYYTEQEVIEYFKGDKCKSLYNKPKLFFFQASKVSKYSADKTPELHTDGTSSNSILTLPTEADLLYLRSCYEGAPSHRPSDSGSWFIQHMCEQFAMINGEISIMDAITIVLNNVKANRSIPMNGSDEYIPNRFIPEVTSTLTTKLLLRKISEPVDDPNIINSIANITYARQKNMGKFFIFNYNQVYDTTAHEFLDRDGTKKDVDDLQKCFTNLGFEVIPNDDLQKDDIFVVINREKNYYADDTCVAVAILTHGINGKLGTWDEEMSEEELFKKFCAKKRPDLINKPKIFFLQVCRGTSITGAVSEQGHLTSPTELSTPTDDSVLTTDAGVMATQDLPQISQPLVEDDYVVVHSTYAGTRAHRSPTNGTWFIQQLCDTFKSQTQTNPESLIDMIREVQQEVARNKIYVDEENNSIHKQMPVICSTLTNRLMLGPYKTSNNENKSV